MASTQKLHTESRGLLCPLCRSNDISGAAFETGVGVAYQPCECLACGATWDDTYTLTGYSNLYKPATDTKKLRLVISLDGGLITAIGSNGVYPVEIVSIDYDIEGLEVDELMDIPMHAADYMPSEDTEEAYAFNRDGEVFTAPEWVDAVFHVVTESEG